MNGRSALPNVELVHRHEQESKKWRQKMEVLLVMGILQRVKIVTHTIAQVRKNMLLMIKCLLS